MLHLPLKEYLNKQVSKVPSEISNMVDEPQEKTISNPKPEPEANLLKSWQGMHTPQEKPSTPKAEGPLHLGNIKARANFRTGWPVLIPLP